MQEVAEHQRQLEALPDERESRQEEERLAAEIQGLEKTCQYQDIDMKATLDKQQKTDAEVHPHPPACCCWKLVPYCFSMHSIISLTQNCAHCCCCCMTVTAYSLLVYTWLQLESALDECHLGNTSGLMHACSTSLFFASDIKSGLSHLDLGHDLADSPVQD